MYSTHLLFCVVPDFFPAAGKGWPAAVCLSLSDLHLVNVACICIPFTLEDCYTIEISADGYTLFLTYILLPMALTTLLVLSLEPQSFKYTLTQIFSSLQRIN